MMTKFRTAGLVGCAMALAFAAAEVCAQAPPVGGTVTATLCGKLEHRLNCADVFGKKPADVGKCSFTGRCAGPSHRCVDNPEHDGLMGEREIGDWTTKYEQMTTDVPASAAKEMDSEAMKCVHVYACETDCELLRGKWTCVKRASTSGEMNVFKYSEVGPCPQQPGPGPGPAGP